MNRQIRICMFEGFWEIFGRAHKEFYPDTQEMMSRNMTEALGKYVAIKYYEYADCFSKHGK